MLIVLSPAKTMDFSEAGPEGLESSPQFGKEAEVLAGILRKMKPAILAQLMSLSSRLAYENHERYQQWKANEVIPVARQALLAYKGDVYNGLRADSLDRDELLWAQERLRILSGLYGILRPMDLIMPYRLEFATKLGVKQYKNLYEYWRKPLARSLESLAKAEGSGILVNLASAEYYKALEPAAAGLRVITPVFKEYRNGDLKFLSMFGKQARGLMARYIIRNRIEEPEQLKLFDAEGYAYSEPLSGGDEWVFTR